MVIGIVVTFCLLIAGVVAIWFSPLRRCLLQTVPALDRFRFTCHVEQFTDESQPAQRDQFFRVQMIGRIPTTRDSVDTNVQLEILDVTEGRLHPQSVLSVDEDYRNEENAEFCFVNHSGVVPQKNSILARWAMVAQLPCHILRFSYRGRRKLMFLVTVLEAETGTKLVTDQKTLEYVYCSDGYREVRDRRCDILRSCLELAVLAFGKTSAISNDIQSLWATWVQDKSEPFMAPGEAKGMIEEILENASDLAINDSSETLLAYGQGTDVFLALELILETAALSGNVTSEMYQRISKIVKTLEIRQDRFLVIAQKILLSSHCRIEEPSHLLGISPGMDVESFRKRLNEEYRKWNARVTHPDPQIRNQADQVLTLIANIRTQRFQSCC